MMNNYKISVIIPIFNMVEYIEKTLLSIVSQKSRNIEFIIVDGGSTDGTLRIIEKYNKFIDIFISEPDRGQYDAINKGINRANGDVIAWLNADDIYFPWTLKSVKKIFDLYNEINWIIGLPSFLNSKDELTHIYLYPGSKPQSYIKNGWFRKNLFGYLQQESIFFKKSLWLKSGGFNLNYKLAADFELWTKFAKFSELTTVNLPLAAFRKRKNSRSKLMENDYYLEVKSICKAKQSPPPFLFNFIGSLSVSSNHLLRFLIRKNSPLLLYNINLEEWKFVYKKRQINNMTLSQLILQR